MPGSLAKEVEACLGIFWKLGDEMHRSKSKNEIIFRGGLFLILILSVLSACGSGDNTSTSVVVVESKCRNPSK